MAKEFSAADIFNTRVDDQYQADFIVDQAYLTPEKTEEVITAPFENEEPSIVAPEEILDDVPLVAIPQTTEEVFVFENEPEKPEKEIKIDFSKVKEKVENLKNLHKTKKENHKKEFLEEAIEEVEVKEPMTPQKKRNKIIFTSVMALAAALIFVLFLVFLLQQYAFVMPNHDDYGYATLSYVYWEEGMWGQNFTMDQLIHYLTQHYNRWGGRILSFGQSILLLRQGLDFAQGFHAITLCATFLLAFLFAQNGKKTKWMPLAALFTCALLGMIGKDISISGFYWYCAAILYTVPILYVFVGAWLLYVMLLDKREKTISVSKLMMLPFATVLFFFAGWSMEQVGIFAVVVVASMLVYACFTRRNPLLLIYGVPPMLSATAGCHILINSIGNNSRQSTHIDYYGLPFSKQLLTSGDTIAKTLFGAENILTVLLIALVAVSAAIFIAKKKKNIFSCTLICLNSILAAFSLAVSAHNIKSAEVSIWLWIYLVVMAITVTIWLFSTKRKQDYLIWALFFGSLASQGACLISPIFPDRCLMMFVLTLVVVASRAFNEGVSLFEKFERKKAIASILSVTFAFSIMGAMGMYQVYNGFKENDRVQQYNNKMLEITGKMYDEFDVVVEEIPLMKLKDDTYAGSTQPYDRDLIKDWIKIYYKLPDNLQYEDFVYEDYNEKRISELEEILKETENKYNELKNNA